MSSVDNADAASRPNFKTVAEDPWSYPIVLIMLFGAGVLIMLGFKLPHRLESIAMMLLISGAALCFGGIFGFLFGIPRSVQEAKKNGTDDDKSDARYLPNTNLEQISDWLTKMIVGVGLIELSKIPAKFISLSHYLATAFGYTANNQNLSDSMVAVILVYFGIAGFLSFYLWTRISLTQAFEAAVNRKMIIKLQTEVSVQERENMIHGHIVLARTLRNEGKLNEALSEVNKSLKLEPTKHAEFVKAWILSKKGDYVGAIECLNRGLKLPPDTYMMDNASVLWNMGCYLTLSSREHNPEQLQEIIKNLDESIKIRPEYKDDIRTEKDLKGLLDNPAFKAHYNL